MSSSFPPTTAITKAIAAAVGRNSEATKQFVRAGSEMTQQIVDNELRKYTADVLALMTGDTGGADPVTYAADPAALETYSDMPLAGGAASATRARKAKSPAKKAKKAKKAKSPAKSPAKKAGKKAAAPKPKTAKGKATAEGEWR